MTVKGLNNVKEKILPTSELKSCVKLEVAVLGSPSLIVLMVSVDQRYYSSVVPLCGRKATFEEEVS